MYYYYYILCDPTYRVWRRDKISPLVDFNKEVNHSPDGRLLGVENQGKLLTSSTSRDEEGSSVGKRPCRVQITDLKRLHIYGLGNRSKSR